MAMAGKNTKKRRLVPAQSFVYDKLSEVLEVSSEFFRTCPSSNVLIGILNFAVSDVPEFNS